MLKKVISIAALSLLAAGQAHALPSLGSLTGGSSSSSSGATADASGAWLPAAKCWWPSPTWRTRLA